jgi:hypothetical protein
MSFVFSVEIDLETSPFLSRIPEVSISKSPFPFMSLAEGHAFLNFPSIFEARPEEWE